LRTQHLGARAFIPVALVGAIFFSFASSTPAAASADTTEAQQIVRIARAQLGDPYHWGSMGPSSFDCSGLVIYAYRNAGDGAVIRSRYLRSARSMYLYFKARGKTSRSHPKIGDLVIWGGGSHIGIYVGGGNAISALTNGVRVHWIFAVRARFTAFIHTGMSTRLAG
jgi:cell wall-associated NlpC family hydrolase